MQGVVNFLENMTKLRDSSIEETDLERGGNRGKALTALSEDGCGEQRT